MEQKSMSGRKSSLGSFTGGGVDGALSSLLPFMGHSMAVPASKYITRLFIVSYIKIVIKMVFLNKPLSRIRYDK
ncbi:hypothetical protein [Akkermansia sp.]|uniref:hypothetical protein n=1 Tax=Akkermansia sp. TaxID=1872421 RepID=UPI0025E4012F|nr:hypothetical protein [uncultured Akkermansia sp.]